MRLLFASLLLALLGVVAAANPVDSGRLYASLAPIWRWPFAPMTQIIVENDSRYDSKRRASQRAASRRTKSAVKQPADIVVLLNTAFAQARCNAQLFG